MRKATNTCRKRGPTFHDKCEPLKAANEPRQLVDPLHFPFNRTIKELRVMS